MAFTCPKCHQVHTTYRLIQQHFDLLPTHAVVDCGTCNPEFRTKAISRQQRLEDRPQRIEAKPPRQHCHVGRKEPREKRPNRSHASSSPATKPIRCKRCPRVFTTPVSLAQHMEDAPEHAGLIKGGPFPCNICGQQFVLKTALLQHLKALPVVHLDASSRQEMISADSERTKSRQSAMSGNGTHADKIPSHAGVKLRIPAMSSNRMRLIKAPLKPENSPPRPISSSSRTPSDQPPTFKCSICSRAFPAKYQLLQHCSNTAGHTKIQ